MGGQHIRFLVATAAAAIASCRQLPLHEVPPATVVPATTVERWTDGEVARQVSLSTSERLSGPASSDRLCLDSLEQIALEGHPSLRQAAAVIGKAHGARRQLDRIPNPMLGYMGDEIGEAGSAGMQGGFVGQTFITGGKLRWNRAVADREIERLRLQWEAQRQRIQTDVRLQFVEALGAERRLELAGELEEVMEDGVRTARRLYDAGQAPRSDLLQAEIQLAEVRVLRENAAYDLDAARRQLAHVAGVVELPPVPLDGDLEADLPERDWTHEFVRLMAASPELRQAGAAVDRARTLVRRQQVQPVPNIEAQVGVMQMVMADDVVASVMVGVPVPLFNRNQGNIDRAWSELHRASLETERLQLMLGFRLAGALRDWQKARNTVVRFRDEVLPRERENLDLTERAYELLEFDFLRVLTARRSYIEASLRYVEALIELHKADVVLDGLLLTGGLEAVPDTDLDDSLRNQALMGQ